MHSLIGILVLLYEGEKKFSCAKNIVEQKFYKIQSHAQIKCKRSSGAFAIAHTLSDVRVVSFKS